MVQQRAEEFGFIRMKYRYTAIEIGKEKERMICIGCPR